MTVSLVGLAGDGRDGSARGLEAGGDGDARGRAVVELDDVARRAGRQVGGEQGHRAGVTGRDVEHGDLVVAGPAKPDGSPVGGGGPVELLDQFDRAGCEAVVVGDVTILERVVDRDGGIGMKTGTVDDDVDRSHRWRARRPCRSCRTGRGRRRGR